MLAEEKKKTKFKIYYIPERTFPGDNRNFTDFNIATGKLENRIKFKLKGNYIRIGYDVDTNKDLLNTDIKELLYRGMTSRLLLWERNYWYLYKYESVNKLFEVLKITPDFSFQVHPRVKHIDIIKIYNTVPLNDKYKNSDGYRPHIYPTRIFKHRIFSIVPISDKEYNKLKELKQPFYKFNKKIISVQ